MKEKDCPFHRVLNVINKKWSMLVLSYLGYHDEAGFNDLENELKGVTPRALSEVLKSLMSEGFINRKRLNGIPPRVQYSLSDKGSELLQVIDPLIRWTAYHTDHKNCGILDSINRWVVSEGRK